MKIDYRRSKLWFTADNHFGHANVIKFCERPFDTIEEMDQHLINKWNEVVEPDHHVYHLGDFTFGEDANKYFKQLNGHIYILGITWHHDRHWLNPYLEWYDFGIKSKNGIAISVLSPLEVVEIKGLTERKYNLPITLCHYPIAEWDRKHYGAFHLHGHSHGKHRGKGKILDVGVDNIYKLFGKYRPINLEEVIEYMKKVEVSFWGQWLRYIPALQRVWE